MTTSAYDDAFAQARVAISAKRAREIMQLKNWEHGMCGCLNEMCIRDRDYLRLENSVSRSPRFVIDLTPLTTLNNLRALSVFGIHVASLRPLARMPALKGLLIKGTPLHDLSVLAESESLRSLDITAFGFDSENEQLQLLRDTNPILDVRALPDNYDEE